MDIAYISALAALAGSVVGGLTSGLTTPPGEVDVHGGTREWRLPCRKKERALQYEPIRDWRFAQAIEKPLHGEVLEEFLERTRL